MPAGRCLRKNIRALTALLALLFCPPKAGFCQAKAFTPSPDEVRLCALLTADFRAELQKRGSGREILSYFSSPEHPLPNIYIKNGSPGQLAYFDSRTGLIFLDARAARRFFGLGNMTPEKFSSWLAARPKAARRLCASADALYLHELTHASQLLRFASYAPELERAKPVQFEYEAYITQDRYTDEKLRQSPSRLKKYFTAPGRDIYLESALATYLSLSLDMEKYRAMIKERYMADDPDYYSAETSSATLASGATAQAGAPAGLNSSLDAFYRNEWPKFSAGALLFVGKIADEVKNYPLALQCLALNRPAAETAGVDAQLADELQTSAAVAILHARNYIRDNAAKIDTAHLGDLLTALDKACADTGRIFPVELEKLKRKIYPRVLPMFKQRAKKMHDPEYRRYYAEKADFIEAQSSVAISGSQLPQAVKPAD